MSSPRSRLAWLALLLPLGYLPGYFGGSRPGFLDTLVLLAATALAFWAIDRLARSPAVVGTTTGVAGVARGTPSLAGRAAWPLLLLLGAVLFAAWVGPASIARVEALGRKEAFSVGIFQQALWWTDRGVPLGVTYSTSDGTLHSQYGIHFSPLLMALSPLYHLRPESSTLLWAQALLLGLAALPLYALARRRIGRAGAGLLGLGWFLHPTILGAPLTGFHDLAFAPILLFTAFWAMSRRRGWTYLLAILALMALREDMALIVVMLGFVAAFTRAPGHYAVGSIFLGGLWFAVALGWVMPGYRPAALVAAPDVFLRQYLGAWGQTPGEIVAHVVAQPMELVRRLVSRDALLYLLALLRPMGFLLPLPDPSWLAALPTLALNMASEGATLKSPVGRYSLPVVAAFFAALPGALAFFGRRLGSAPPARNLPAAGGTIEERGAALREAAHHGSLWGKNPPVSMDADATTGRRGAPAAALVVTAALAALFLVRIDRQFVPAPRPDLADMKAALAAVPDSVAVLAPDWSYAALANRGTWACIGTLEERALEKGVLGRFQVVVVDMGESSYERERYPTLLPALLLRLQGERDFRQAVVAGGVHVFVRTGTASASSGSAPRR